MASSMPARSDGWPAPASSNRPDLADLRRTIARIEGVPADRLEEPEAAEPKAQGNTPGRGRRTVPRLSLGVAAADAALGGGLPASGLTELRLSQTRDAGAATGFSLALAVLLKADAERPVLWIGERFVYREGGAFHRAGLATFGLDPRALLIVETRRFAEAIWAGEEAARSGAPALVVLEARGNPKHLGLEGTRRLHWRARASGLPLLVLRQAGWPEPTAAPVRLRVDPGPSAPADTPRLVGRPAFRITLEKSPDGRPARFDLEWNAHEHRFQPRSDAVPGLVPDATVDRSDPARAARPVVAFRRAS